MTNLNSIILSRRREFGMSRAELARRANAKYKQLEHLERGQSKHPDFNLVVKVAKVLRLNVLEIFTKINTSDNEIKQVSEEFFDAKPNDTP